MDETASEKARRRQVWIGIFVSLVSLGAIFLVVKPNEIIASLRVAQYGYLLLVALSLVVFLLLRAVRWRFMLTGGQKAKIAVPYGSVFHIQNIGYLLNNILPLRLGDVARAVLVGNVPPITISEGLSTMVVERILDLLLIVVLFPFTLSAVATLPPEVRAASRAVGILAVTGTVVLVLAANQHERALRWLDKLLRRIKFLDPESWLRRAEGLLRGLDTLTRPVDGVVLVLLSILVWLPIILGYYYGMLAVNLQVTMSQAAFVVCVAAFSVTAPSSPGQVGVFEAGVTFALAAILGLPEAESASFAFLYHAVNYLVVGVLGVVAIVATSATFGSVIASTREFVRSRAR